MLVSQKVVKVEGGVYDCVLMTFEVKCVNCWGLVSSIGASRVHWNWRVKDMSESGMSGIQVTGECVIFWGII